MKQKPKRKIIRTYICKRTGMIMMETIKMIKKKK